MEIDPEPAGKRALRMFLNPGAAAEYKRRHDAIWPELVALLKESGISDYGIWLDESIRCCSPCCATRTRPCWTASPRTP